VRLFLRASQAVSWLSRSRQSGTSGSLVHGGLLAAFVVSCTATASSPYPTAEGGSTTSGGAVAPSSGVSSGSNAGGQGGTVASAGAVSAGGESGIGAGSGSAVSGTTAVLEDGGEADGGSGDDAAEGGSDSAGTAEGGGGCAGKTYKLCEDFETGTVGGIPPGWTTLQGFSSQRGGAGLADDQAHSGSMSFPGTRQDRAPLDAAPVRSLGRS